MLWVAPEASQIRSDQLSTGGELVEASSPMNYDAKVKGMAGSGIHPLRRFRG